MVSVAFFDLLVFMVCVGRALPYWGSASFHISIRSRIKTEFGSPSLYRVAGRSGHHPRWGDGYGMQKPESYTLTARKIFCANNRCVYI